MSRAALALDTDPAQASKSRETAGGLRVNKPGDAFEVEAERVAETVSEGGRIGNWARSAANWSLSKLDIGQVQRDSTGNPSPGQTPAPKPNNYDEALGKLGEAFLKTDIGKQILDAVQKDPLVKGAESFVDTLPGKLVVGAAAVGTVSALAATHQPLPAQIPSIPLDMIKPGLSVKLKYEGPVDHPTAASLTFSYTPKSPSEGKKPKQTATEKQRAQNVRAQADLYNYQESLKSPEQRKAEAEDTQRLINTWVTRPGAHLETGGIDVSKYSPATPAKPSGLQLTSPQFQSPLKPKTPTLLDQHLELKPMTAPSATPDAAKPATDEKKKEEIPVQRRAEPAATVNSDSADVESVLASSGRPLDPETRRYMESRIGFDFGKVRVHADTRAAASARALGARAYTVGSDVVFGQGRFAPQTTEGRRLLAHELTHVVQQSSPPARPHPVVRSAPRHVQRFLEAAKEWLLGKVREIPGYPLFCVVIGQDLITGQQVERNATNIIEGVLKLFDGGPELFEKLKKAADALETAYQWVLAQFRNLGLTTDYFFGILNKALDAVELLHPIDSFNRVKDIFREPLNKLIELASRLGKAALDFILQAVLDNFPLGKKVYELFKKAGSVLSRIAADPISFAKHLLDAVKLGFENFGTNILDHLGEGLKKWIFEEIGLTDIKIPEKFDFASILNLVLQVLKLTYEQRRPQLVESLGEDAVYFFETAGEILTKVRKQGFVAIWDEIKKRASDLFDSVIEKARNWVVEQIVKLGLVKIAALATPIGDAIEVITGIYETIKFFIEKATKFVELLDGIVNSLSDMVDGKIEAAAKKVEDTLANSIPLILRFLAGLLHLSGIGEEIRKIIEAIRKPINDAIGKVLDFIIDKAKPIWDKAKEAFLGKLAAVKEWWKKPKKFRYAEEPHELVVEGEGEHPQVFVQSTKTPLEQFLSDIKATPKQTKDILKLASQLGWRKGELQKPADDEKGSRLYDKLADMLDHLKAREAPKSVTKDQTTHALGGGVKADAFLSSNREVGTDPHGEDPPIWNDLGDKLRRDKSYVRGHLLSMRLGGLGEWKNMMPITNTVNQRMNSQVENALKKATVPGGRFFHYVVEAQYADNVMQSLDDKAPAADKKQRALEAEKRLIKLSWTVKPADFDKDGGGWKETTGDLLDAQGNKLPDRVAAGDFTPPTVT